MDYRHLIDEEARIRTLRNIVDECAQKLATENLSDEEALDLIEATRRKTLGLFPGKEGQFELIYRPRFMRIVEEKKK